MSTVQQITSESENRLVATLGRWGMRPVRCRACGERAWAKRIDVMANGEKATAYHSVNVHLDSGRVECGGECIRTATQKDWNDFAAGRLG